MRQGVWGRAGLAALSMLSVIGMTGCSLLPKEDDAIHNVVVTESETKAYELAETIRTDLSRTKLLYFKYSQMSEESHSFELDGYRVAEVYFEKGDEVHKGDVIARLDVSGEEAALTELKFKQETEALELKHLKERMQYELQNAAGNDAMIASIKTRYQDYFKNYEDSAYILKLQIDNAQQVIDKSEIRAGMDGVISYMRPKLETIWTKADEKIVTVIDVSQCAFRTEKNEFSEKLEVGQQITITKSDQTTYTGTVVADSEAPDPNYIYLSIDNLDLELSVGTEAKYYLVLDKRDNVLAIPSATIHKNGDKRYVYIENESGLKEIKYVTTGLVGDSLTEIIEGLAEGECVIK